jgi:hypothetical protein
MQSETFEQWMRRLYKPERFRNEPGFHADREQRRLITDRKKDAREQCFALISHHDSVPGRTEFFGMLPAGAPRLPLHPSLSFS